MLFKNLRYWSCLPLGEGAERSEAEGGCVASTISIINFALHNPQSSPTAMPAPLQGAYKSS